MTRTPTPCPGAGRRWVPGMGRAVCPVCKVSSRTLPETAHVNPSAILSLRETVPTHIHASTRTDR